MKWYDWVGIYALNFISGALLMGICILLFKEWWQQFIAFSVGIIIFIPFLIWNANACEKYFRLKK
jgi:hypothetical protein